MFRRILLSFICILLLALPLHVTAEPPASAVTERLATLDIISQLDERFQSERYYYYNAMFFEQGCLPSSVHNALVAVLGTPETSADELLAEILIDLCASEEQWSYAIITNRLSEMLTTPAADSATASLVAGTDDIRVWDSLLNPDKTLQEIRLRAQGILLLEKLTLNDSWEQLCQLILQLEAANYGHARLAFASVAVGLGEFYEAPFGSGSNGHYVALYLEVDEFCRDGTFYLLDSVPRALLGEERGYGMLYQELYPFALRNKLLFNEYYKPQRITPSILKFTLAPGEQATLLQLLQDPHLSDQARFDERVALHKRHLDTVRVYSVSQALLYIP